MTDLREKLELPKVGGNIIAYHAPGYKVGASQIEERFYWQVEFVFLGPDGRYNPGVARLDPKQIEQLIVALEEAFQKMKVLEGQSFSGKFSKRTGQIYNPAIEIKAQGGKTWVDFWVSSGTYRFRRTLSSTDVEVIIGKLKVVKQQGQRMLETLKAIV